MEKENALKILRELHDKALFSERTALETFIPELKESEDEKIRKTLVELVKYAKENCLELLNKPFNVVSMDAMLAWLENIPYTIDHEKREGFHLGYKAGLEKQCEQKSADELAWSEGDEVLLSSVINSLLIFEDSGASKMKIDWLKHIRKRIKGE